VVLQVRRGLAGSERAKAPSCDGAIDIGPLWNSMYSGRFSLPNQLAPSCSARARRRDAVDHAQLQMVLQVFADAGQVDQRRDAHGWCRLAAGPMPDSCRICGEPIAPAASRVSRRAVAVKRVPPPVNCTPRQSLPLFRRFDQQRSTWQPVMMVRFGRCAAGFRKALAVFRRMPRAG
jgi:hypothetical protein